MASPFRVGQTVSLQIPELEPGKWFPVQVMDQDEDRVLMVSVPMEQGREVPVAPEYKVLLEVVLADGLRRMSAYVLSRETRPFHLRLDWPTTEERIQRRDAVRVTVMFPAYVRALEQTGRVGTRVNGTVVDLSAGGARILLPQSFFEGAHLEIALQIPGLGERIVPARVIRVTESESVAGPLQFVTGTQFLDLKESVRREITKFVFDTQLEHHRRGGV